MKKILVTSIILTFLLFMSLVAANEAEEIAEGKKLVESKATCASLTDDQLEAVGEYYMDQIHPGDAHKLMDQMMGGEDSTQLKQIHQLMAKRFYCNENTQFGMGMMMGGTSMMSWNNGWWSIYAILYTLLLIGLLVLVVLAIIWLWKKVIGKK